MGAKLLIFLIQMQLHFSRPARELSHFIMFQSRGAKIENAHRAKNQRKMFLRDLIRFWASPFLMNVLCVFNEKED
jgi:hypothetical protein